MSHKEGNGLRVRQRTVPASSVVWPGSTAPSSVFDIARAKEEAPKPKYTRAKLPALDISAIKIEKGIAIPPQARGTRVSPYVVLLDRLGPNESFKVPGAYRTAVTACVSKYRKDIKGTPKGTREFTVRSTEAECRVWRTK